ncbi:iron complex transport system substrate-binding protein [Raoultella sp. BIGb0149]|uniref:ABC transporter substrate-binding protein n=1 Tax=Raoultella TaxID=160674 RepID=UPI00105D5021|nr:MULTISPECIES: ABC transporter substrate-binding protein [Raoultella]TDQ23410.1 iron complex transport system substrate-binding protein [Raoultella sp. BIGb0149]
MKKIAAALLCAWLTFPALASRQLTDDAGRSVTLPDRVDRIAEGWFAHHSLLMTLGAGDTIVATVNRPDSRPWMFHLTPRLNQALISRGPHFTSEALLARGAEVVFVARGNGDAEAYRQAGLPVMEMSFTDYPSLARSVTTTAEVLGTPQALARAQAYNRYLQQAIARIGQRTAALTDAERPRVLHIQSLKPLKVDGGHTLIDTWIRLAGGQNAAVGIEGNMQEISPEKVLAWQPDVIILGAGCGDLAHSAYRDLFSTLRAVKNHRVLQNPAGVFPWDRYGSESALQIQWAAKQLQPQRFAEIDMLAVTRDFYQRFFDYPLSEAEASRILQALPPQREDAK